MAQNQKKVLDDKPLKKALEKAWREVNDAEDKKSIEKEVTILKNNISKIEAAQKIE